METINGKKTGDPPVRVASFLYPGLGLYILPPCAYRIYVPMVVYNPHLVFFQPFFMTDYQGGN